MILAPGTKHGPYEILFPIGSGGMDKIPNRESETIRCMHIDRREALICIENLFF
jgi:hypothetical protein